MSLESKARKSLKQGDFATASAAAKELVLQDQSKPTGYFLLGIVAAEIGDMANALALLEAAVQRGPRAEHLAQLARVLSLLHREGDAARAARAAYDLNPEEAITLDTIGCVFTRLGDHEGSLAPFRAAVAKAPANQDYRYNLAAACGFTGKVDEARALYEEILGEDPVNARVHYALALLSRHTADNHHVPRLEAALAEANSPDDRLRIRYALAKELEDLGDARSFTFLKAANDEHKRTIGYDFAQDQAVFDALEQLFRKGEGALFTSTGDPAQAPIFVIGMPRTGTTLVDRILSSHPEVGSAGELQAMPVAVKRLAQTRSHQVIDAETVAASGSSDAAAIGQAYLAQAEHQRPQGSPRFIDKLPANFLYAGHIARALPEARIVCLRRQPMDTIWSNYKNLFASQSAYYAYSYDLLDTARYYARFDRLMRMWEELMPGRILQLGYEQLVADQERQTRRLLAHCGLEWDPACLAFHENRAAVATPSAAQVRRPLNADAIGKWRTHAEALEPARAWLAAQGIDPEAAWKSD
ncbi:tetratricopeptide repeat-containing sulfotransferase family protein [Aurantiacibacter suaedae]|uniref:tetratricopeptide repeat-containing sulfotransferase family protein n=1 Tax=Aurantiacibacter suaedae TaxID=2545755 RepID=UPI0010F94B46|nr:sulfotransferase [Aurantiacibacter suaedae]